MPGHIGTSIVSNSRTIQSGSESEELSPNEVLAARQRLKGMGIDTAPMSDDRYPEDRARPRAHLPRRRADHGGGRGQDPPRRRQGRALAHSRRRRRPQVRRAGAAGPGRGLHTGVLQELYGRGRLASRVESRGSDFESEPRLLFVDAFSRPKSRGLARKRDCPIRVQRAGASPDDRRGGGGLSDRACLHRRVTAKAEILGTGRADRPAAPFVAEFEQRAAVARLR